MLHWHGQRNMKWTQLLPMLEQLASEGQVPDVLIVHLGENDIRPATGLSIISTIRREVILFWDLFSNMKVIWSNLLPRRTRLNKAPRARQKVNCAVGQLASRLGSTLIEHPKIVHTDPTLSSVGLSFFLGDLKNGILTHLRSSRATVAFAFPVPYCTCVFVCVPQVSLE